MPAVPAQEPGPSVFPGAHERCADINFYLVDTNGVTGAGGASLDGISVRAADGAAEVFCVEIDPKRRMVSSRPSLYRKNMLPDCVPPGKQLADGRRQIVSFFLSGDMCDLNVFILTEMDHSIGTITPVTIADLAREFFDQISVGHPRIATALWWETLVNAAIQREWTISLGQRSASERMRIRYASSSSACGWAD